jgi:plastocyanin
MRTFFVVALIVSALLLVPAPPRVSAARTWNVQVGASAVNQADQALLFLPSTITIDAGDSVQWKLAASDHTIYFPAGQKPPDLIIPGKAKGALLWNPKVFFASPKTAYDGTGPISGGALLHDPNAPKAFRLTFTKPGTYTYLCMFHPGMEGKVIVQPAGSPYPMTQAQYGAEGAKQAKAALAKAEALRTATKPAITMSGGKRTYTLNLVGSVKDHVTVYRFPAGNLTINRGDTVTWVMQDPTELHTVSFGVGTRPFDIVTMQRQPQGPPLLQVTPDVVAPAGGTIQRGAGFYNSGFMMTEGPGVRRYGLTFTKSGTFNYTCAVHDDFGMKAVITVR